MNPTASTEELSVAGLADRVESLDWPQIESDLESDGCAIAKGLLLPDQCRALAALYPQDEPFPLPEAVATLRRSLYPHLAAVANRWNQAMKIAVSYPTDHDEYLERCHAAGQIRPTPLLLQYGEGDYNCLHQDMYGEFVFPLQVAFLLSAPGEDFTGGEFILMEQRPRMQSRGEVVPLRQGDGVIFAVHHRPVQGTRGTYRVKLRHGVSRLRSGHRHTVGIIFHDAQ